MLQRGRPLATCDVVIVMNKGADGSGMPDDFRARLEKLRVRQRG